jgi:hypothetical protein
MEIGGRRRNDKKKDNTKAADELRSGVQIPPRPLLITLDVRNLVVILE